MKRDEAAQVMAGWRDHALLCEQRARDNGLPGYVQFSYITLPLQNPDGSMRPVYITAELLDACVEALTDVSAKADAEKEIAELKAVLAMQESAIVKLVMKLPGEAKPVPLLGKCI
jgi:hypothetical protein